MKNFYIFKILGIFIFLLTLSACETVDTTSYDGFKRTSSEFKYHAYACPASDPDVHVGCGLGPGNSQQQANTNALEVCSRNFSDCVIIKEGNRTVYTKEDANRIQMATLIEDSKNTCKSLGFNEGTDKFTDCTLKLYSQKLDLAEKQNQQVVVQNQGSSTVRVIDVTRERETTMRRSMGLINGTCTLATYYSC